MGFLVGDLKQNFMILFSISVLVLVGIVVGYGFVLSNYQYWTCWDACLWTGEDSCDEVCKEENKRPRPSEIEKQEKSQRLKDMYRPIFVEYQENKNNEGWMMNSRGYSHPYSLEDNLKVEYKFGNGFLIYLQKIEITSTLSETNPGEIMVLKEMMFPEMWVFLVSAAGMFGAIGITMRKK